jgi:hypothetical protein
MFGAEIFLLSTQQYDLQHTVARSKGINCFDTLAQREVGKLFLTLLDFKVNAMV